METEFLKAFACYVDPGNTRNLPTSFNSRPHTAVVFGRAGTERIERRQYQASICAGGQKISRSLVSIGFAHMPSFPGFLCFRLKHGTALLPFSMMV